ncbi:MAG: hypothetical protein KDJ25_09720 [Rhodoblastus sp.]|nr:hypothetical protein [Rhodoblastus sp.]
MKDSKGKITGKIERETKDYDVIKDDPGIWELILFTFLIYVFTFLMIWGIFGVIIQIATKIIKGSANYSISFDISWSIGLVGGVLASGYHAYKYISKQKNRNAIKSDFLNIIYVIIFIALIFAVFFIISWAFN